MQQHIYYIRYALQFADMQITELVTSFNHEVKNPGQSIVSSYICKGYREVRIQCSPVLSWNSL